MALKRKIKDISRELALKGLTALVLTGATLMPLPTKAEEIVHTNPPVAQYYDEHGKFNREKYIEDLDAQAKKIHDLKEKSISLSLGYILDKPINVFFEPDTTRDVGWDRYNKSIEAQETRINLITSGFAQSIVDVFPYIPDYFNCENFARATCIEFSGFLRYVDSISTAHAIYDTLVSPNTFGFPCYDITVFTPEFSHGFNGFMVGNDLISLSNWKFVEPQTDKQIIFGDLSYPENTSAMTISQDIYSFFGEDIPTSVPIISFTLENGVPTSYWINPYEEVILERPDIPTDINDPNTLEIPESFILNQNSPNPFNPKTIINYSLPKKSHVHLDIYNILGQKINTAVDETQSAGSYKYEIDFSNNSSGIYFYNLTADGYSGTKKMLLLK